MTRLIISFIICGALSSCTKRAGIGYEQGLFLSKSASDFENVSTRLHDWLLSSKLEITSSPGGMAAWSGLHMEGEKVQWYRLQIGRHPLLLRITLDPRSKQIQASTDYGGDFTTSELAQIRRANLKLWNDIFNWMESQPEQNELLRHKPKWFESARTGVNKEFLD
jgi:hypothetical protein